MSHVFPIIVAHHHKNIGVLNWTNLTLHETTLIPSQIHVVPVVLSPGYLWELGGSSQDLQVVNNHGQWLLSPPKDRVGLDPFPNGQTSWLINGGDPKHLRPSWEPILQVPGDDTTAPGVLRIR